MKTQIGLSSTNRQGGLFIQLQAIFGVPLPIGLRRGSQFNAVPTHRLDVETSGYLLCSRSKSAASLGAELFSTGRLSKSYLAVARGVSALDGWEINVPLGFDTNSEIPIKMGSGTLSATTRFEVIERFIAQCSFLQCQRVVANIRFVSMLGCRDFR